MPTSRLALVLALVSLLASCSSIRGADTTFGVRSEEQVQPPANETAAAREEAPRPAPALHAGDADVALFVTLEGELWTERMRRNVLARLPEALAAQGQVRIYADEKLQTLGRLRNERDGLSDEWLTQVRRRLGWSPPDVILEVTLRAGEGAARSAATDRNETYAEFGVRARAVRLDGERRGEVAEHGHALIYGRVLDGAAEDIRKMILGKLMP